MISGRDLHNSQWSQCSVVVSLLLSVRNLHNYYFQRRANNVVFSKNSISPTEKEEAYANASRLRKISKLSEWCRGIIAGEMLEGEGVCGLWM